MLLEKDYLSLQERLKSSQHVLDEEVKENQRREAFIWKLETVLRCRKAMIKLSFAIKIALFAKPLQLFAIINFIIA